GDGKTYTQSGIYDYVTSSEDGCENILRLHLTITDGPVADAPSDVTACGSYTLPALANGNYFRQPDSQSPVAVGTVLTETTTLYVAAGKPDEEECYAENSFTVTITDEETPVFAQLGPFCQNTAAPALPLTSNN